MKNIQEHDAPPDDSMTGHRLVDKLIAKFRSEVAESGDPDLEEDQSIAIAEDSQNNFGLTGFVLFLALTVSLVFRRRSTKR